MSSDEDYSLVSDNGLECQSSLEEIRQETENYKEKYRQLITDQEMVSKAIEAEKHFAEEFRQRAVSREEMQLEEEQEQAKHREVLQGMLLLLQQEESCLEEQELKAKQALHRLETMTDIVQQQTQVPTTVPEKNVIFTGALSDEDSCNFDIKPHILYPMEGGTALLTFEEEEVAEKIMDLKHHKVTLGECFVTLQAEPVWVLEPSYIEMDTHICPKRILVSNLPKTLETSRMLDKLDIHFSKSRNGGGEVEAAEFLPDSGNVVITFLQDDVAKALTDRLIHNVDFGTGRNQRVHVNPFMNGEITTLKTRMSKSARTVLLTGIPTVMEQEDLQDHLEIHFQKTINGGGEIDAIAYNPIGQHRLAIFLEDCPAP